jgi:hypothetical protein
MGVPEATMHEDRLAMPGKDNIGSSRKVLAMKSEAIAHGMKKPPNP